MKKFLFMLLCMLGVGISYAEEVNISMNVQSESETWLRTVPGYFYLDNKCLIFDEGHDCWSNDVVVYDYNLNPSTVHFNSEWLCQDIMMRDTRYEMYTSQYIPFTQCYFNNDALYEAIACDGKKVIDNWGDESMEYYNYRVINQKGDVLYTFEVPQGYEFSYKPEFSKVSDDVIIVEIEFTNGYDDYGESKGYCTCYYALKVGQTGSLAPIKQMHKMKLGCNPVVKGDNLVVTVSDSSRQSPIIVTSASGVTIKVVPVIDGRAVIGTSDMPCGLYVASQKGGASAKFIVK